MAEQASAGNKVLIAMDGSDNAFQAFHFFMDTIFRSDMHLLIVHCPDYSSFLKTPVLSVDSSAVSKMVKHCQDDMDHLEAKIKEHLEKAGVEKAQMLSLHGDPGPAIVKASRDHSANLIVTGSRGLSTVRRTLIGSVSNHVLHHAHCPVLICQTKHEAKHS